MPELVEPTLAQATIDGTAPAVEPQTKVVGTRKAFEKLFEGDFVGLRAVSYVVSPSLVLEFMESKGITSAEIVVGESFASEFKDRLAEKAPEDALRLVELYKTGKVRFLFPSRTIHSKLYLLSKPGLTRVIVTSANLTRKAQEAARQVNYACYFDLAPGHPLLTQFEKDYSEHLEECEPFLDDLLRKLEGVPDADREQVVKQWLEGETTVSEEARAFESDLIERAIEAVQTQPDQPVFTLRLPNPGPARRAAESIAGPFPQANGGEVSVNARHVFDRLRQIVGLPYLKMAPNGVTIFMDGRQQMRTSPLPAPQDVSLALENLEAYCHTVDLGQCRDPGKVKMSFMEVILYVLTAPFLHEHMKSMRTRFGIVHKRGPKFLYVHGNSSNGKTTLLGFALKLIAGHPVEPIPGREFKKTRILEAAETGTIFPLAFDDANVASASGSEDLFKSYWENLWKPDRPIPQVLITSNRTLLNDWAKTRAKRIDLAVSFSSNPEDQEKLNLIFSFNNRIFEWFSSLYLQKLPIVAGDDELATARQVVLELYAYAGRPVPDFFPREAVEKVYDPGREQWREIVALRKVEMFPLRNRLRIEFTGDFQAHEVQTFRSYLPARLNAEKKGKTIMVENPNAFYEWLEGERRQSWWKRMWTRSPTGGR